MSVLKLSREQFAILFVVLGVLGISVFGLYSGTRIDRYRPINEDESQILKVLIMFQKAKAEYHLENYLFCLSEKGKFMFAGAIMVSKKELKKLLPSFWSNLRTNRLNSLPSSREELNGNFFDGSFYDPVIEVANKKAKVILTFMTPGARWRTTLFLNMKKNTRFWKITRLEWDMG